MHYSSLIHDWKMEFVEYVLIVDRENTKKVKQYDYDY